MMDHTLSYHSALRGQQGFTLIEILIVLVLTAIALLALGTFSLAVMDSGTVSRERLNAVHLAEQVIEEWQHDSDDWLPVIASDCTMSAAGTAPSYPATFTCTFASGMNEAFTVEAKVAAARAPLPDASAYGDMSPTLTFINPPMVKLVTVSWSHKGKPKSIYLTHLTR